MISMSSLLRAAPVHAHASGIGTSEIGASSAISSGFYNFAVKTGALGTNVMLSKPGCATWHVSRHPIGRIIMQSRTTGGATICDGTTQPRSFEFLIQAIDDAHRLSLNGWPVAENAIAVLPPGRPFALVCQGPYRSTSISVPLDMLSEGCPSRARLHELGARPCIIKPSSIEAKRLAMAMIEAADLTRHEAVSARVDRFIDIERDLRVNLLAAMGSSDSSIQVPRSNSSLDSINHRALAVIRSPDELNLKVEHLSRAISVAERSLHRAFHRFFGVGPAQYIKLQRLNRLHRELHADKPRGATVTDAMTHCGLTEFGRFAGAYRALFGESPSETLKRTIAVTGRPRSAAGVGVMH